MNLLSAFASRGNKAFNQLQILTGCRSEIISLLPHNPGWVSLRARALAIGTSLSVCVEYEMLTTCAGEVRCPP